MTAYLYITKYFNFFTWRDCTEILLFSVACYYLLLWLKKDRSKQLLFHFYGYCIIIFLTYILQLSTITYGLLLFSPAIIMLFMFMHEDILQRNMIALKNITAPLATPIDWVSCLMRSTLTALNNGTELLVIIENSDSLKGHLNAEYHISASATNDMLTLLIACQLWNTRHMLWIKNDGTIQGIAATWKTNWGQRAYDQSMGWIDDAITYTSKTDALIVCSNATTHSYSLVHAGILYEKLTADQTNQLFRRHSNMQTSLVKEGSRYENLRKPNQHEQHTH